MDNSSQCQCKSIGAKGQVFTIFIFKKLAFNFNTVKNWSGYAFQGQVHRDTVKGQEYQKQYYTKLCGVYPF